MIDSLTEHFAWVAKYWHVITGVVLVSWWTVVRFKRGLLLEYVTQKEMQACRDVILEELKVLKKDNAEQHQSILETIIEALRK